MESSKGKTIKEAAFKVHSKKVKTIESAESYALNCLLKYLSISFSKAKVLITGDCKNLIDQINADIYNDKVYKHNENVDIIYKKRNMSTQWKSRDFNQKADSLTKIAHEKRINVYQKKDYSNEYKEYNLSQ